jgi:hypothetical protein
MESQPYGRPLSALRDEFWMIQKLGCGGFGKVYLVIKVFFDLCFIDCITTVKAVKNYNISNIKKRTLITNAFVISFLFRQIKMV